MANTKAFNVIKCDTDAAYTGPLNIESISYIPGTGSPDAVITQTDTNGSKIWSAGASSSRLNDAVCIRLNNDDTLYINVTGTGTEVYLYLEAD